MNIDDVKKKIKERRINSYINGVEVKKEIKKNPKLFSFFVRLMILTILFLGSLIYIKSSTDNKQAFYDVLFKKNISFAFINNLYNKYLGGILPFKDLIKDNKPVFSEKLVYTESNIYKDGVALSVEKGYLVPVLNSGIVVFVGEKDDYGKTVIVQQVNGINVWYANIDNINVKIYDYVEQGSLLGEALNSKLYLVFEKEGKALNYKDYIE